MSCLIKYKDGYYTEENFNELLNPSSSMSVKDYKDQLISKLQNLDIVGKRKFNNEYWVKKTEQYQDPNRYTPEETERKNLKKIEEINTKLGYDAVQIVRRGSGYIVRINAQLKAFNELYTLPETFEDEDYVPYIYENLYGSNPQPVTSDVLNNAAIMARDLGREDLIEIIRFIYQHLQKNPGLKINVLDKFDEIDKAMIGSSTLTVAFYDASINEVNMSKQQFDLLTVEENIEAILEEILHGFTVQPFLHKFPTQADKIYMGKVNKLYNEYKNKVPKEALLQYRFSNAREFIIGLTVDRGFQNYLASLNSETKENFFVKLWNDFINAVRRFLNIPENKRKSTIEVLRGNMLDIINEWLVAQNKIGNGIKELGRDYDLTMSTISRSVIDAEKAKMRDGITEDYKDEFKKRVKKLIDYVSIAGNTKSNLDADENFFFLFKEAKKLNENIIDEVDYFFDFIRELGAITNVAVSKMKATRDSDSSREAKIRDFSKIYITMSSYAHIFRELNDLKEQIPLGTRLSQTINTIIVNQQTVDSLYKINIKPLVASRTAEIAGPASDIAIEDQNAIIAGLTTRLQSAKNRGRTAIVRLLENKIKREEKILDKISFTPEKVNDILSGVYGDSNLLTTWMEPAIVNPNIAPAALAKHTTDAYASVAPQIADNNNAFQSALNKYALATGLNQNNIVSFSSPLIQTVKTVESLKDDGEFEYKEHLALLSPYNLDYIQEIQKFTRRSIDLSHKISHAKTDDERKGFVKQKQELINQRKQFIKDYMEQPYLEEVHAAMEMLDEDLGGFNARQYIGELYDNKNFYEKEILSSQTEEQLDLLMNQIESIDFEIKRLRSTFEKDPESREFKVAEHLRNYDKEISKYREFFLTPKGKAKFEAEKRRTDAMLESGELSEKQHNYWYQKNTVTEYDESYWEKKKQILIDLADIRDKMGIKTDDKSDLNKLYKDIEGIVKAYRDNEGVINGLRVPENEAAVVKKLEEKIEELKSLIGNIYGLTKEDRSRLANIEKQLDDLDIEIIYAYNTTKAEQIKQKFDELNAEMDKILAKKKNLDRKLVEKYYKTIRILSDLDHSTNTHYYEEALVLQTDKLMATVDISNMPSEVKTMSAEFQPIRYKKEGNEWIRYVGKDKDVVEPIEVENAYRYDRASERLDQTEWWEKNHITRNKWVPSEDYSPGDPASSQGSYRDVVEPIYIWRHTSPKLGIHIKTDQPSFKYKISRIKKEFTNPNYRRSIDGYNIPKLQGAKDDRFVNKEYQRLKNSTDPKDKATFEALEFLTEQHFNSQSDGKIPMAHKLGYFLPSVRKTNTERLLGTSTADIVSKIKGIGKSVQEEFKKNEQDKDILFGYNDTLSSIPVKYVGNIDINDQTRDVFRSILLFTTESLIRDRLMKALPYALALKEIVSAPENKPVKLDSKGNVVTILKKMSGHKDAAKLIPGESSTAKQINEYIRTYYFGESIKDEPGVKTLNTLLAFGAKALLGINFSASIVNRMNAWTQSLLESESKTGAFTFKEMLKAQMIYDANIINLNLPSDIGKYGNKSFISQLHDHFGGNNFNIINKQNKTLAYGKFTEGIGKLLIPNEMAEHAIGHQLFIAMSMHTKVKQGDTMIPLFEAYELVNGNIRLKKGVEFTEKQRLQFISRMNSAARRINGNYNKMDKVQAQKYALGRLVLFMNNYFVPFLTRRFGHKRFSIEDGISQEGFWRVFGRTVFKDLFTYRSNILLSWKSYTPEERVAVVRSFSEMGISFMAIAIIAALGGDEPEDLKDNSILANNTIYVLKMFRRQNEQFMLVPGLGLDDIYQKAKSPFPIMGKIGNLFSMFNHGMYTMGYELGLGIDEKDVMYTRRSGWHEKGDYKITTDISRLFGVFYRINQMQHPDVAIKNMDAYRIK